MKKHRIVTWLSLLALLLGIVLPIATSASSAKAAPEDGNQTTVHIHKLKASSFDDKALELVNKHKGIEILDPKDLGEDVKPLSDVTFHIYKADDVEKAFPAPDAPTTPDAPLDKDIDDDTDPNAVEDAKTQSIEEIVANWEEENANKLKSVKEVTSVTTGDDGVADATLPDGKYVVVEDYPDEVSSAIAVPFILTLPSYGENNEKLDELHVYPKNIVSDEEPQPSKVIKTDDGAKTQASYDIGDDISWLLQSTIPDNFGDYGKFEFHDTIDEKLDFDGANAVASVKIGDTLLTKSKVKDDGGDYTVNVNDRTITIALTKDGIAKVAGAAKGNNNKLIAEVKTTINEKAVPGQPIENTVSITFNNREGSGKDHDKDKPGQPNGEAPHVVTGGKRFQKVNGADENETLDGAEFYVYRDSEGKNPVKATEALLEANPNADERDGNLLLTSGIVDANGSFEIKGLKFDEENGTTYYLKEITAPDGYVLPEKPFDFKVDAKSYYENPDQLAEVLPIKNIKRPEIPNTGGIGSFALIAVGIVLVGGSVYYFNKQRKDA